MTIQNRESDNYNESNLMVLAMMDLQSSLLSSIPCYDSLLESSEIILQSANLLGIPVVITEQVPEKLGHTHDIITKLAHSAQVIHKNTFSAFGSPGFLNFLNDSHAEHLILCGLETSICIYLTALDAINRGMRVTVLLDGVSCRRNIDGKWALSELRHRGASLIPLETFFYAQLNSSSHDCFKDISSLIKKRSCFKP